MNRLLITFCCLILSQIAFSQTDTIRFVYYRYNDFYDVRLYKHGENQATIEVGIFKYRKKGTKTTSRQHEIGIDAYNAVMQSISDISVGAISNISERQLQLRLGHFGYCLQVVRGNDCIFSCYTTEERYDAYRKIATLARLKKRKLGL